MGECVGDCVWIRVSVCEYSVCRDECMCKCVYVNECVDDSVGVSVYSECVRTNVGECIWYECRDECVRVGV